MATMGGAAAAVDTTGLLTKCDQLPMMTARRLNSGSRMAVNNGLALLRRQPEIEAIVFTSRHGELERNLRILLALSKQESLSPTDFAMSVHNSAVGSLTIAAQAPLVSTSFPPVLTPSSKGCLKWRPCSRRVFPCAVGGFRWRHS